MSVLDPATPEQDTHSRLSRSPHLMPDVQWEEGPVDKVPNAVRHGIIAWHARNLSKVVLRTTGKGTTTLPTFAIGKEFHYDQARRQLNLPRTRLLNILGTGLVLPASKPSDRVIMYSAFEIDLSLPDIQSTSLSENGMYICSYEEAADELNKNYGRGHKRATLVSYALLQHMGLVT